MQYLGRLDSVQLRSLRILVGVCALLLLLLIGYVDSMTGKHCSEWLVSGWAVPFVWLIPFASLLTQAKYWFMYGYRPNPVALVFGILTPLGLGYLRHANVAYIPSSSPPSILVAFRLLVRLLPFQLLALMLVGAVILHRVYLLKVMRRRGHSFRFAWDARGVIGIKFVVMTAGRIVASGVPLFVFRYVANWWNRDPRTSSWLFAAKLFFRSNCACKQARRIGCGVASWPPVHCPVAVAPVFGHGGPWLLHTSCPRRRLQRPY